MSSEDADAAAGAAAARQNALACQVDVSKHIFVWSVLKISLLEICLVWFGCFQAYFCLVCFENWQSYLFRAGFICFCGEIFQACFRWFFSAFQGILVLILFLSLLFCPLGKFLIDSLLCRFFSPILNWLVNMQQHCVMMKLFPNIPLQLSDVWKGSKRRRKRTTTTLVWSHAPSAPCEESQVAR